MSLTRPLLGLFLLLALLLAAPPAQAQGGTPGPVTDDQVNQVAKQLYCPVCRNVPLDVCPTAACAQWRATIREKLEAGWSERQILDYFAAQYGEQALASPSTRGINWLVWLMPPVLLLLGGITLMRFLRASAAGAPAPMARPPSLPSAPAAADEYAERLERELRRRA